MKKIDKTIERAEHLLRVLQVVKTAGRKQTKRIRELRRRVILGTALLIVDSVSPRCHGDHCGRSG